MADVPPALKVKGPLQTTKRAALVALRNTKGMSLIQPILNRDMDVVGGHVTPGVVMIAQCVARVRIVLRRASRIHRTL
jgi:hypothetical protein